MRSRTRFRVALALVFCVILLIKPRLRQAPLTAHASGELYAALPVPSVDAGIRAYKSGELLIKFSPSMPAQQTGSLQALAQIGAVQVGELTTLGVERWRVPIGQEAALAEQLGSLPGIEYAEPNFIRRAHLTPNDAYYNSRQWAHPVINSPAAWDITTGSSTVRVAVIDTGVDLQNNELQGRLVSGHDYVNNDDDPDDDHGHGTHVAGVIAAAGNNGQGIAGMAWQTQIMPMKVLNSNGSGYDSDTATAIKDATDAGADIINISLGGATPSQTLYNAIRYAYDRGVLLVASAGNCGDSDFIDNNCQYQNQPVYPAAYDTEVFAVAATSEYDTAAAFSNRGTYVDIAAPGVNIYSTVLNNQYWWASGTSQAAPHVAGLAALLLAADSTLTAQEIRTHIEATSVDLGNAGWDSGYGAGRINASGALEHATLTLAPPTILTINNDDRDRDFLVDWSDVLNATSYVLEEDDSVSFSSPATVYDGEFSQAQIIGRGDGTWYYRTRAIRANAALISDWSGISSAKVGLSAPELTPINNVGSADYTVSWNAVDGATAYRLQESATANFSNATIYPDSAGLNRNFTNQDGGVWFYRVQATTGVSDSDWSATQSATVSPKAPLLHAIVAGTAPDAYTITWSESTGATHYRLQESADAGFTSVITRYLGTATSYAITGQQAGTWHYRADAANAAGSSPPSNAQDFSVTMPVIPIPNLNPIQALDTSDVYTVSWSIVPAATGYILEESKAPWFDIPTTAYTGPLTLVTVLHQYPGTWYYRVRAQTPAGDSPWSMMESTTVFAYMFLPLVMR